jgi:hypothetical protein
MAELRVKGTGTLKLFESDNTSSVTIASPASLGADRTVTVPDADVTLLTGWSTDSGTNDSLVPDSASAGIYLGVAAATAANLLDDYEEGTWTPALVNAATASFNQQVGSYTKIGQQVTMHLNLSISDLDGGSGDTIISGLPFTASNSPANSWYSADVLGDDSWSTDLSGTNLIAYIKGAYLPDNLTIRKDSGSNLDDVNLTEIGTSRVQVSISYNTAS